MRNIWIFLKILAFYLSNTVAYVDEAAGDDDLDDDDFDKIDSTSVRISFKIVK